ALKKGAPLASALGSGRLAMAGPDVPAGRYGEAGLKSLGLWEAVKDKTARGENVRAALALVARGEAALRIAYEHDAMAEPRARVVALFPAGSHPKIVYPVAITAQAKSPAAAAYLGFLSGPEAKAVFKKYGFSLLAR